MSKAKLKTYGVIALVSLVTLAVINRVPQAAPVRKLVSGS